MANTGFLFSYTIEEYFTDVPGGEPTGLEKPNLPDDPDYLAPVMNPTACPIPETTTYTNTAISGPGSYNRTTCGEGYQGGPATVIVAADSYFSTVSQAAAQAQAVAAWQALDTQAFADVNGSCLLTDARVGLGYVQPGPSGSSVVMIFNSGNLGGTFVVQLSNSLGFSQQYNQSNFTQSSNPITVYQSFQTGVTWSLSEVSGGVQIQTASLTT